MRLILSPRFRGLFWTQLFGAFNDNFFKQALLILVVFKGFGGGGYNEDKLSMFAAGLFILPFFFFSATAGQLADKYDKAMLVQRIKFIEVLLALTAALGLFLKSLPFLLVALGLLGLQSTFFGPVKYGIIPQLLGDDDLVEGNALVETGTKLAILGGTLLGGTLAKPEQAQMLISAVLILVAVAGFMTAKTITSLPPADADLVVQWNPVTPTIQIMQMARRNRAVLLSILGVSWFWALGGGLLALLPVYGKDVLGVNSDVVMLFTGMFSVGVGIGAVLCGALSHHRLELGLVPFGSIGISVFLFDMVITGAPFTVNPDALLTPSQVLHDPQGWRILFDLTCLSVCSGLFIVPLVTVIQQRTEEQYRSRVIAANNVINALFMVLSLVMLAGLLEAGVGVIGRFAVLAGLNLFVGFYIYSVIPEFFLRFLAYLLNHVIYRKTVSGAENVPKEGPAVLVGNHVSFIDWLVMLGAVHRPIRFVMWHSYYNLPLVRFLFRDAGAIPIASGKTHPELLAAAFDAIDKNLEEGNLVCIFPAGELTVDGEMGEWRKGVERILERRSVPVVPFALQGLWDSLFSRQPDRTFGSRFKRLFRPRISVVIGEQVPAPSESEVGGIAARLREIVAQLRADKK